MFGDRIQEYVSVQNYHMKVTDFCVVWAEVVEQMQAVKSDLSRALLTGDTGQQVLLFRQLQEYFVIIRNLGNEKLDVSSHLLEMVTSCIHNRIA